ncbi:MAG TPA: hypothetical protein VJG83_00890 [archaeon]|nr:hypothetical protein [archaeon]
MYSGEYKRYLLIPAILLVVFLVLIFAFPGIKKGIDLTGGTNIIVRADTPLDSQLILPLLKEKYPLTELSVGSVSSVGGYGLFIQYGQNTDLQGAKKLLGDAKSQLPQNPQNARLLALQSIALSSKYNPGQVIDSESLEDEQAVEAAEASLISAEKNFDLELQNLIATTYNLGPQIRFQKTQIGPSLGETFYGLAVQALVMGVILLSIVIFIYFRELLTSITVIAATIFNILGAAALMSLFSIPISLTTIPALLMLIGYAVDTEIVMSARVLKRKEGSPKERMNDSIGTIFTMSSTAIAAVFVMALLSYFAQIGVIFEISAVLLFGLLCDLISSTFMNAPLILMHAEKKEERS